MLIREKKNNLLLKIAIITTFILIFLSNIYCNEIDTYQEDLNNLIKEQRNTISKLTGVDKEIAQEQYEILELDIKITKYANELNDLQKKVDDITKKLGEHENTLANSDQIFIQAQDTYTKRLVTIYENGIPTMVDMLLTSKGITEFFRKVSVYTIILEYDKSLVGNLKSQKQYIDYIKKDIEVQKLQIEKLKSDKEKSTQSLNDARAAKETKIASLESSKEALQARLDYLEKQKEEVDKKIESEIEKIKNEAIERARSSSNTAITFTGGEFAWPVPGYNMITTKFNVGYDPWGTGKTTIHMGVDVAGAGIYGKPIVSMQDGVVSLAKYYGGYGNCVIINHGTSQTDGNLYISLYGHASSINVEVGQTVKKGDVIAYIGSTGNSTGPHLHLELHKGKPEAGSKAERIDPLSCFPDIKFICL